jgi:hypothetical protein
LLLVSAIKTGSWAAEDLQFATVNIGAS